MVQHLQVENIVIGLDAGEMPPELAAAMTRGTRDAGSKVMSIGLLGN